MRRKEIKRWEKNCTQDAWLCNEKWASSGSSNTASAIGSTLPAVLGWFRPVVLLPVRALTGLTEAQIEAVIAHELAHIRRLDCFVNLFQIATETLLFYHRRYGG